MRVPAGDDVPDRLVRVFRQDFLGKVGTEELVNDLSGDRVDQPGLLPSAQ